MSKWRVVIASLLLVALAMLAGVAGPVQASHELIEIEVEDVGFENEAGDVGAEKVEIDIVPPTQPPDGPHQPGQ